MGGLSRPHGPGSGPIAKRHEAACLKATLIVETRVELPDVVIGPQPYRRGRTGHAYAALQPRSALVERELWLRAEPPEDVLAMIGRSFRPPDLFSAGTRRSARNFREPSSKRRHHAPQQLLSHRVERLCVGQEQGLEGIGVCPQALANGLLGLPIGLSLSTTTLRSNDHAWARRTAYRVSARLAGTTSSRRTRKVRPSASRMRTPLHWRPPPGRPPPGQTLSRPTRRDEGPVGKRHGGGVDVQHENLGDALRGTRARSVCDG